MSSPHAPSSAPSDAPGAKPRWRRAVAGNVLFLGLASFFTDVSSEMIFPFLPVFLTGLVGAGAAPLYIGIMDGLADFVSSLLKIASGRLSDRAGARKPLALLGYGISSSLRPLMAVAATGWHVVGIRFLDRVGKGIRTSPRDALLGESVDPDVRGLAFSFHRMMDHAGAVTGPAVAAVVLYLALGSGQMLSEENGPVTAREMEALRLLFALAVVPALVAVGCMAFMVREPAPASPPERDAEATDDDAREPRPAPERPPLPGRLKGFLAANAIFTLGAASDLFLLHALRTRFDLHLGHIVLLWMLLHVVKIAVSPLGGALSDRLGRAPVILTGWSFHVAVFAALPFAPGASVAIPIFLAYGAYYGLTEGAERALVADLVPPARRGSAFGWYHGSEGFAALPAGIVFGWTWTTYGSTAPFLLGATLSAIGTLLLGAVILRTGAGVGAPPRIP